MTVRQKLNIYDVDFTNASFTVIKTERIGGRSVGVKNYTLTYDQLIGMFGCNECDMVKPNLYGSTKYTITIR